MGILFEHAVVATGEGGRVLRDAHLLVENGIITALGEGSWVPKHEKTEGHECIDATGKVLLSGFFNAHTHIPMTLLRNYADDMDLHTWLFSKIFPMEDRLDGDAVFWGTQLGLMEMLAGGTVGFTDMYYFCDRTAEAVLDSGMRMLLTRGLTGDGTSGDFSGDIRLAESRALHSAWHGAGNGRIRVGLGPHAIYTCSAPYLSAVAELASTLSATVHIHLDETRREHAECLEKYGKTPVRHCDDLGLFAGPAIAAHCVHITEEDMDILAARNVVMAHNPRSNLKLASGIAPVPSARKAGIRVALGTDGASSNNTLDMWAEMGLAALLHKGATLDPLAITAGEALEMATRIGAAAMGFETSGTLAVGMKADLQMADVSGPHWQPLHNPVSAIVYSGRSADVRLTMADGKILYRNGEFLTIDAEKVRHGVAGTVDKVFGGAFGTAVMV